MSVSVTCPFEGVAAVAARVVFDPEVRADMVLHVAKLVAPLATSLAPVPFAFLTQCRLDVHQNLLPQIFFRKFHVTFS